MNELKFFSNHEFGDLAVILIDGKPHFPATDCAKMLGYTNPHKAIIDHCRYLTKREVPHPQNPDKTIEMNFIPEGDVYRLIVKAADQSKNLAIKEKAERFESWLFDTILPSVQKHGAYLTPETIDSFLRDPSTLYEIVSNWKDTSERNEEMQREINIITMENRLLRKDERIWTDRSFIEACVRRMAAKYYAKAQMISEQMQHAWNSFYYEFSYRYRISLRKRGIDGKTGKKLKSGQSPLDALKPEEMPKAVSTIVSLCNIRGVYIGDLLEHLIDPSIAYDPTYVDPMRVYRMDSDDGADISLS